MQIRHLAPRKSEAPRRHRGGFDAIRHCHRTGMEHVYTLLTRPLRPHVSYYAFAVRSSTRMRTHAVLARDNQRASQLRNCGRPGPGVTHCLNCCRSKRSRHSAPSCLHSPGSAASAPACLRFKVEGSGLRAQGSGLRSGDICCKWGRLLE